MVAFALIVVAAIAIGLAAQVFGGLRAIMAAIVTATCLLPIVAFGPDVDTFHVGIANASPEWRTFTVLFIALAILCILRWGVGCINPAHLLLVGWLVFGLLFLWRDGPMVFSGVLQLVIGVLAWCVGTAVSRMQYSPKVERGLVLIFVVLAVFEAFICILQYIGIPINQLDVMDSSILGERVNGTANHPNNLGKLMFICLIFLLPLTESRRQGRVALFGCFALFIPFVLAQGRANIAALVFALLLWAVFSSGVRFTARRFAIISATVAGVGASATTILSRFEEDPTGGVRDKLTEIAYEAIPSNLWGGVGPNLYVDEIAQYYGSYIPVHNTFLLLAAEIGLVGLALFVAPIAFVIIRAIPKVRVNPYARALVAVTPGWFAISWTGWGVLGTSVFCFFMFAVAYTAGRSREFSIERDGESDDSSEVVVPIETSDSELARKGRIR